MTNTNTTAKPNFGGNFNLGGLPTLIERVCKPDMRMIEVGSWRGFSTNVILEATTSCPSAVLYCVDHWQGSPSTNQPDEIKRLGEDIYETFLRNMFLLNYSHRVIPIKLDSQKAATLFPDAFADLIFIDADHMYDKIQADIKSWWPKVKQGGVFCGHDMHVVYSKLPEKFKTDPEHIAKEQSQGHHVGVTKAVSEFFGEDRIEILPGTIWSVWKK